MRPHRKYRTLGIPPGCVGYVYNFTCPVAWMLMSCLYIAYVLFVKSVCPVATNENVLFVRSVCPVAINENVLLQIYAIVLFVRSVCPVHNMNMSCFNNVHVLLLIQTCSNPKEYIFCWNIWNILMWWCICMYMYSV